MKYELVELKIEGDFVVEYVKQHLRAGGVGVGRSRPLSDFTAEKIERIKEGELLWPNDGANS
jgi:hypothetical protein